MKYIIGIDEVGRGSLAGPLVVGAVILKESIAGLKDSKQLSAKSRDKLALRIIDNGIIGIGWVEPNLIDELGLSRAMKLAINRAMQQINEKYDKIIIDGNINYLSDNVKSNCLVGADKIVPEVSAASIIAKVSRDKFMVSQSKKYPGYGLETNVGYGTAEHIKAIYKLGPCLIHRKSFKPVSLL